MKQSWTLGLNEEKAKEVRSDFKGSFLLRKRLIELLNDKVVQSARTTRSKELYASPSWAYMQADSVGYERALFEVISLISDDSVEK